MAGGRREGGEGEGEEEGEGGREGEGRERERENTLTQLAQYTTCHKQYVHRPHQPALFVA